MRAFFWLLVVMFCSNCVLAQQQLPETEEELKQQILALDQKVETIQLNLGKSEKKLKTGIILALVGYSTTITGGILLGRGNSDAGTALVATGGAIGLAGTVLLVDAFQYIGKAAGEERPKYKKKQQAAAVTPGNP